jgi:hypothetical protein
MKTGLVLFALLFASRSALGQGDSLPPDLPASRYHLTARPWKPLAIPKTAYLDRIEGECRYWAKHEDPSGAIIDPFLRKEWQYSTPYFAFALGVLLGEGRARDLLRKGILAMDHATEGVATGKTDGHLEFYIAPLAQAIALYAPHVPAANVETWRSRLSTPLAPGGGTNNWRTYFMKGEWFRAKAGLLDAAQATREIEKHWGASQEARIGPTRWNLYHDQTSDPDTLAVEVVGRGNLVALVSAGYSGPSRGAMADAVGRGSRTALLLQDPSGQGPANGRTDDHVWGDVGHQLVFETMAEESREGGNLWLAGQYRRAALLAFQNLDRWRRDDGEWAGTFYVTKNRFDPSLRVGYQPASQYSNYNGALALHTAEAFLTRKTEIPENPAPVEIGGYAFATDPGFSAAFANAGGMAMEIDLRGQTKVQFDQYWTALGVVRFGRPGWDTRLGPSDGRRDVSSGFGVSFAPTWEESGRWVRLASSPDRYHGTFTTTFAHPLLTRCSVTWGPQAGQSGPGFRQDFTVTPDGIFSEITPTEVPAGWGVTLPLLEADGAVTLDASTSATERIASVRYPGGRDSENFILLQSDGVEMTREAPVRTSYGDVVPVRATSHDPRSRTFIYPQGEGDPSASAVRDSFRSTPEGFASVLGRVEGTLYVGRTSAGGFGQRMSLGQKDVPDVVFSEACGFILRIEDGQVTHAEADRAVRMTLGARTIPLEAYTPITLVGKPLR